MPSYSTTTLIRAALGGLIALGLSTAAFAQTPTIPPAKSTTPTPAPAPKTTTGTGTTPPKTTTGTGAAGSTGAAAAKGTTPPATTATAGDPTDQTWTKICGTDAATQKSACQTQATVVNTDGSPLASFTLQKFADQEKYGLGVMVPIYVYIPSGVTLLVDGAKKGVAPYSACAPQPAVCIAELLADNVIIDSLKKGKQLSLQMTVIGTNSQKRDVKLDIPLTAFGRTFDLPGIDAAAAQAQQDQLNQALQKRAEERRQKLIDEQNKPATASATK